jgi:hypothetical protein
MDRPMRPLFSRWFNLTRTDRRHAFRLCSFPLIKVVPYLAKDGGYCDDVKRPSSRRLMNNRSITFDISSIGSVHAPEARLFLIMIALVFVGWTALTSTAAPVRIPVEDGKRLTPIHVTIEPMIHEGKKALRVVESTRQYDGNALALVDDVEFTDGTIEIDLAGRPAAGSSDTARGFVGIAFRSTPDGRAFECFYLRPTNGRAEDQLRRNHATQYASEPDYPWQRLRSESPGVYESYVDLEPGAWTHVRLDVDGLKARLFVNGASQPVLIVDDLKRSRASGRVGLWIGAETEAFFRNLTITPR